MAIDRGQTLRGALAGAVAAAVWAAQQPLDKRAFDFDHDDAHLLGRLVTRGPAVRPVGLAMHVANGAAFGALYANLAPRLPLPSWARGPAAAMVENVATFPLAFVVEQVHPGRDELPSFSEAPVRSFAQATWRHLLFGVVLGELERRLNAPRDPEVPAYEHFASSNGHGSLEEVATV